MNDTHAQSGFELAAKILETHPDDAIETLLKYSNGAEADWLEFKAGMTLLPDDEKNGYKPDDLYWDYVLSIVAMANTRGGAFVIGVNDKTHKAVPLSTCDPRHILESEGKEGYLRREVLDRIDRQQRKWTTKDGTIWSLGASVAPHLECRFVPFDGTDVLVILVKPVASGAELFVCQRIKNGDEFESLPFRQLGEVGKVKRLTKPSDIAAYRNSRSVPNPQLNGNDNLPAGVVYGRDGCKRLFIGRKDDLAAVQNALEDNGIVVVYGGGGKGKTSLAERVANEWLKNAGGYAFWIDAEQIQKWTSVFEALLDLDRRIRHVLSKIKEPKSKENIPDDARISKWLLEKSQEGTPVLLILDNVEEPDLFADKELQAWFGRGLPSRFHVLATSRIMIARRNQENPIHQIPLGYLNATDARQLLVSVACETDWNEGTLSKDEKKALDDLVALTRGHAWTINVIGGYIAKSSDPDDYQSEPMSFRSALDAYRARGVTDFSESPDLLGKLLAPTLDKIREKGEDLFNLALFAALVARDGTADRHLLRGYWKQVVGATDTAFERAIKMLVRYSLFDSISEFAVEMHRNTQTVLQAEISKVFLSRAGSFLSGYPGMELRRWPDLLKNGVPTSYCPVRLLDFKTLQSVFPLDWSLLTPDMASSFDAPEIFWLIENGPEKILDYPWQWNRLESVRSWPGMGFPGVFRHLPGAPYYGSSASASGSSPSPALKDFSFSRVRSRPSYWRDVLVKRPALVRYCRLSELSHDDLSSVLAQHPNLVDELSFFRDNPRGIPHYLVVHPESISPGLLSLLDPEGWLFLVEESSNLLDRIPDQTKSLFERIGRIMNERKTERDEQERQEWESQAKYEEIEDKWQEAERLSEKYEVDLLSKEEFLESDDGRAMAVYLMLEPDDASLRPLDPLQPDDWAILFAEKPEFIEAFGSDKLNGATPEGWTAALSRYPDLIDACQAEFDQAGGMNMFSGGQLVDIVTWTPQLLKRCRIEQFSGSNWATLVQRFPSLADYCPWSKLSPKEYAPLLVQHPEWIEQYDLSLKGLDDLQWAELLVRRPDFRTKCHCRFSEKAASDLVAVIQKDPTVLDSLCSQAEQKFFDPLLLFVRPSQGKLLPWVSLVTDDKKTDDQPNFFEEWTKRALPIKWEALDSSDWKSMLRKHPKSVDRFLREKANRCFSGCDWVSVLSDAPWLCEVCDWSQLTADDWIHLLQKGSGSYANEQRQLVQFLPGSLPATDLLRIFGSLPWIERVLPADHPAKVRIAHERTRFENNLRSGRTVIPMEPEELSWPNPALAKFSGDMGRFYANDQLRWLTWEIDHTYRPKNASKTLSLLSSMIFDNQDLSEEEVCHLERRILFALVRRELWDEATLVLDRLPDVVEKAKEFPVDEKHADLSSAVSDGFACFCKGEILWAKGNYNAATLAFNAAQDSSRSFDFEALFSNSGKSSENNSDGQIRPPKPDPGRPFFPSLQTELALSDCKNCVPKELGTFRWSKVLQVNLEHPTRVYGIHL